MGISRRGFLGSTAAAIAGLPLLHAKTSSASGAPDLVDVSGTKPDAMVAAALKTLGGIGAFVKRGQTVVLKANCGFPNPPAWGTTTHPETVLAVAKACLEAKARQVILVEYPQGSPERCLQRCGVEEALKQLPQVKIKLLTAGDFKHVEVKGGVSLKQVDVAKLVLSADVLISIPAAKSHVMTGVSFGLKNAMGLILDRKAFHTTLNLHQAVADLGRVIKPQLTILDATRVLLTNGPQGPGQTQALGRMVAGRDLVAVDAYGLTLTRFNQKQMSPADAQHIKLAGAAGLGELNLGKLKARKVSV